MIPLNMVLSDAHVSWTTNHRGISVKLKKPLYVEFVQGSTSVLFLPSVPLFRDAFNAHLTIAVFFEFDVYFGPIFPRVSGCYFPHVQNSPLKIGTTKHYTEH